MAIPQHYNVKELVALLGWTRQRVYRKFKDNPLVMRDGNRIFVPESVVQETIMRLRQRPAKPVRRGRPPRKKNHPAAGAGCRPTLGSPQGASSANLPG
jgi:hypothetical protein